MADLKGKAQRLRKALQVAEKWVDAAASDTEMFDRATIAHDQLEEELSRTVFEIDVVYQKRIIAQGRKHLRGEVVAGEDLTRESRDSTLSNVLLDAYLMLSVAPLEVFGVGNRVAEERTRYLMMGALMVAMDAANAKHEPEPPTA
jgi:hypothetical protein